jgi:hypothetical protein
VVVVRQKNNNKARQQQEFQVKPLVPEVSREEAKVEKQQG